jgi:sulfite exporter TauE/SafE
LVPYLLSEGKSTKQNVIILSQFLSGRLAGYLIFALLAFGISSTLSLTSLNRKLLLGTAYTLLSVVLFLYAQTPKTACAAHSLGRFTLWFTEKHPCSMPLIMGFLTGVNLCPPFLLVFTEAIGTQNILQALLYFFTFFLGTALYFLPLPFLSFKQKDSLKTIGHIASVVMSIYYLYIGVFMLIGGIKNL